MLQIPISWTKGTVTLQNRKGDENENRRFGL